MFTKRLSSAVIALAAVTALLFASPALAVTGTWSAPVNLSANGRDANSPQITVDANGLATAIWRRDDGSNFIIQASTSLNGGAWSTPVNLSATGGAAYNPQVTVDANGLATAVWQRSGGNGLIIQSSTSLNGGTWSTPVNLSAPGANALDPQISVDNNGLATAIWQRFNGTSYIIQARTSLNGAPWSTTVNLTTTGNDAFSPQITVDANGLATAVWEYTGGGNAIIQSSTSLNGGTWSTPINLSANVGDAHNPQIAVDSTGLATAIWLRSDGNNSIIQASTSLNGGAWSTPVDLSATGNDAFTPQVTVDTNGMATALWQRFDGTSYIIQSSTSLNGGAWSTPVNLSLAGGDAFNPQVTKEANGLATAIWQRFDGTIMTIQASTSLDGATWSTPVDLSTPGGDAIDPQVTVDANGLVTAIWQRNDGNNTIVQSSTFSTPAVPSVDNPALATTGVGISTMGFLASGAILLSLLGTGILITSRRRTTGQ